MNNISVLRSNSEYRALVKSIRQLKSPEQAWKFAALHRHGGEGLAAALTPAKKSAPFSDLHSWSFGPFGPF